MKVGGFEIPEDLICQYLKIMKDMECKNGDYLMLDKEREDTHNEILNLLNLQRGIDYRAIHDLDNAIGELYFEVYPIPYCDTPSKLITKNRA